MKNLILPVLLSILIWSCSKEPPVQPQSNSQTDLKSSKKGKIDLEFTGLPSLGPDFRYEGWIIVNDAPVSTGKFNITPSGIMAPSVFPVDKDDLNSATAFVLTIEPQPDPDPAPSNVHILGGEFSGDQASLSIAFSGALGTDFSSAAGTYVLATPTTSTTDDELSGIWFLDLSSGSPMAGLTLPTLPGGWQYEGWAVIDGIPVTTGKFTSVTGADMAAPYSSMENPAPPFPGEDFVMNAPDGLMFPTDLSGGTAVISVEPDPDNSASPFAIKPLLGDILANAQDHYNYPMSLNAGSFPVGTATK